ncbi:UNVERIFIED_CONTAM: hypothetical protein Scaly_2793000 [Sesamum calycinum]|uniref:Retrotransposon Copia-like N-terminal domain-containing protein n=1 Tax=Sesamum calycinum TaxID=2727403 RepID=A0AAW2IYC5_9LAMI
MLMQNASLGNIVRLDLDDKGNVAGYVTLDLSPPAPHPFQREERGLWPGCPLLQGRVNGIAPFSHIASSSNAVPDASTGEARSGAETGITQTQIAEGSGLVMISTPLTGNNWLTWSILVRITFEGKDKSGFIDGSIVKPTEGTVEFKQWRIENSMVRTWILSTMSKDIVNAFLYAASTRSSWLELEAWYGECDEPLLYKIQREISSMSQGNMSDTAYYTNLEQLWYEFDLFNAACNVYVCEILALDPLPTVNKAYSMVLRVERQRQVKSLQRLHGILELYKDLSEQRRRGGQTNKVYAVNETTNNSTTKGSATDNDLVSDLIEALSIVQGKGAQDLEMDLMSNQTLAIVKQVGKLYYLDSISFLSVHACQQPVSSVVNNVTVNSNYTLWHRRLGHTSPLVLNHIEVLNVDESDKTGPILVPTHPLNDSPDTIIEPVSPAPISPHIDTIFPATESIQPPLPEHLRRSQRQSKPPAWLTDFHYNLSSDLFFHPSNASEASPAWLKEVAFSSCPEGINGFIKLNCGQMAVWTDARQESKIEQVKHLLDAAFTIKDLGPAK